MKLAIISHKPCWHSNYSHGKIATDGGFPFQVKAISELFEATSVLVPCSKDSNRRNETILEGKNLVVVPLTQPYGKEIYRKALLPIWAVINLPKLIRRILAADCVHAPIPGDIGTIGMILALLMKKRLFVRHCGNWFIQRTAAEKFWKWFMEWIGSSKNIMFATGGSDEPPSKNNRHINWIFSTSLTEKEISALREKREGLSPPKRLVIVCRQERAKGTETVLRALPLVAARHPDIELDVVGDGSDLEYFKNLAEKLKIDDRVRFHGNVSHEKVIRILSQASIFCFPTRSYEGFPKVVLEALAVGLPVITTRVSVLPYLLRSGCGLLMSVGSPQELADLVAKLLSDNKLWQRMSEASLETAKEYTLENWKKSISEALFGARKDYAATASST